MWIPKVFVIMPFLLVALANYILQTVCAIDIVRGSRHYSNTSDYSNIATFHDVVNIAFRIIHILEYCVLFGSLICKCGEFPILQKHTCLAVKYVLCRACSRDSVLKCIKVFIESLLLFSLLALYFAVIVLASRTHPLWDECSKEKSLRCPYVVCVTNVIADMSFTYIVRMFMVYVTIHVAATWLQGEHQLNDKRIDQDNLKRLLKRYKEVGEVAYSLHVIFKRWFVLQWLVYFFEILVDFYFIYDVLSTGSQGVYSLGDGEHTQAQELKLHALFLAYRIFSFVTPYLCGLTMNYYHRRYYEALNKKLRDIQQRAEDETEQKLLQVNQERAGSERRLREERQDRPQTAQEEQQRVSQWEMLRQDLQKEMIALRQTLWKMQQEVQRNTITVIPENRKYQFRPSIYEISIPLNETAHILTISLAFVAFILSLISKSVSVSND